MISTRWCAGLAAGLASAAALAGARPSDSRPAVASGQYAVVVSRKTHADAGWRRVIDALREKHEAKVIVYEKSVADAREKLAAALPRYACFVAPPAETGRQFVVDVHRMTRKLDDDPYTDVLWGILTGYEPDDALRIARHTKPLIIRRGASGTVAMSLAPFDEAVKFDERARSVKWVKTAGGKQEKQTCPADSTAAIVETLNKFKPDLFMTSGHATPRDWQIGYSYRNGQFRCRDGQLYGLDLKKKRHPIRSPNPKVYLPVGNCLMGHIPQRDCMALAFMRTGGVYQMIGYVVNTWYGYGGWGVRDLLLAQPGRFSLAEAFYLNNQALVHRLRTEYPDKADVNFEKFDMERDRGLLDKLAAKHGLVDEKARKFRKDTAGLLWDRDTVAFYGDPAWDARLAPRDLAWKQTLTESGGTWTFEIVARQDGKWPGRPVMAMLPRRVGQVRVTEGADLKPLITDNFILVPLKGRFEKGRIVRVAFTAARR